MEESFNPEEINSSIVRTHSVYSTIFIKVMETIASVYCVLECWAVMNSYSISLFLIIIWYHRFSFKSLSRPKESDLSQIIDSRRWARNLNVAHVTSGASYSNTRLCSPTM